MSKRIEAGASVRNHWRGACLGKPVVMAKDTDGLPQESFLYPALM